MGIICNHCGKMNKKISNYCNGCGSELLCMTGEKVAGRYEIIELIKTSSFGAVYKAKDNKLGISCIIKELFQDPNNQSALARFKREAEILASLKTQKPARRHRSFCSGKPLLSYNGLC